MVDAVQSEFYSPVWALQRKDEETLDFEAQKAATAAGYPPLKATDPLPRYDQYVKIEGFSANEIRFSYLENGQEVQRSVFKDATPSKFADVDKVKGILEDTRGTAAAKGWQLPKTDWKAPPLKDIEKIETTNEIDGQKAYLIKLKGDDKPFLATEGLHPDAYKQIGEREKLMALVKANNDEGYETFSDKNKLPPFKDYIRFSDEGEEKRGGSKGIAFEYKDSGGNVKKGIVHEDVDKAAFDQVRNERDSRAKANDYAVKNNLTVADDSFQIPQRAWTDVKKVEGLGQDAYEVTVYDSDKRKKVVDKKLVLRGAVSNEKFSRLINYSKVGEDGEFWKKFENFGVRMWDQPKFDTKGSQLTDTNVDWVSKDLINSGYVIIKFKDSGSGPFVGETIAIDEKFSPEAFAVARKYAEGGGDSMPGTPTGMDQPDQTVYLTNPASSSFAWNKLYKEIVDAKY